MTQPAKQAFAPVMAYKDMFDQIVRPQKIRLPPQIVQDGDCFGERLRPIPQGLPQEGFGRAAVGKIKEVLFPPPQQG